MVSIGVLLSEGSV